MKFMVNVNPGGAIFVKGYDFFVSQGGLTASWGKGWAPVEARSIAQARLHAMRHMGGNRRGLFCPSCGNESHAGECPIDAADSGTVAKLNDEIRRARRKFPGNRFLLAALTEEVGELAQALLQNKSREDVEKEALQVACVALRILEEGDASFADIGPEESLK